MTKNPHWLLGVDGGGTSCRVKLCDASGKVIAQGRAGSANVRLGVENTYSAILSATYQALDQAGLATEILQHTYAGFGLAGAVSTQLNHSISQYPHPFAKVAVDSDAVAACLGAHQGEDGAILILGTGSCGMLNSNNHFSVLGGWGFLISDHASGARMGLHLVRSALEACEGMREASHLSSALMHRFEHNPSLLLHWADRSQPSDFGELAPLVIKHYLQGDALAQQIVDNTRAEAAMLLNRLQELGAAKICMMGGLSQFIEPLLEHEFSEFLTRPRGDAMDGALIMAANIVDGK
ncbi:MAG: hypothetical protein MJK10_17375 [Pseudomonadales bacterium]|nr:hypothetical protein [Pseudomonadales bacterium]NRA17905.1 N-acetylglucosamine kinase [Oceanospirillaceae bacterium]